MPPAEQPRSSRLQELPQLVVGASKVLGIDQLQDLEDHAELDPLLRRAQSPRGEVSDASSERSPLVRAQGSVSGGCWNFSVGLGGLRWAALLDRRPGIEQEAFGARCLIE